MKKNTIYILFCLLLIYNSSQAQVFTDVTSTSGVSSVTEMPDLFGSGASIVDYDKDGDLDIFVGTQFGLLNQLYQNQGNGQFLEIASSVGLTSTYRNRATLWFDYDGDQDLDLLLLGDCLNVDETCQDRMAVFLYKQDDLGVFSEVTDSGISFGSRYTLPNVNLNTVVGGVAAGDINNDGWLDIIITVWGKRFSGAKISMFLNDKDGTFTDISAASNLDETSVSRYQPIFHDFNRDGFLDISINVDFSENEFWLNNGDNTFENIALSLGVDSAFNEMGMTLGDYDNDGDFDYYATNISRVEDGVLRHNIFMRNDWQLNNNLAFTEISNNTGISVGNSGWDWGTTFFDANNNGFLDLASTNGWGEEGWGADQSRLWQNIDGQFFGDISNASNFNDMLDATTLLAFDKDRDGDLDLLQSMKRNGGDLTPIRIYENNTRASNTSNNYLVVKPRMNGTNHFAIGAVVKILYDNGQTGMRLITAGTSFYGQEPAEAFFGLADNTNVDKITIEWPDNTVTEVNDVAANQVITVTNDNVLETNDLGIFQFKLYPNPVIDIINIEGNEMINQVEIYNILGQKMFESTVKSKKIQIDIASLSAGNYFLKIQDSNSTLQTFRIVKK